MRSQCISRPFATWSLPTTGTLFSLWHATTQALQPTHRLKSIAMPQAWPVYSRLFQRLSSGGWWTIWSAKRGCSCHCRCVASRTSTGTRSTICSIPCSSMAWWFWVVTSSWSSDPFATCTAGISCGFAPANSG